MGRKVLAHELKPVNLDDFTLIELPVMPTVMKKHIAKLCYMLSVTSFPGELNCKRALSKLACAFVLMTALPVSVSLAGSMPGWYQVGTWPGFRTAAISYTFDDNCPNQYAEAVPMFNAAGFKMTLFTVTSWVGSWSNVQYAASCGHEIASHTVDHQTLAFMPPGTLLPELTNSQNAINANATNQLCVTIAYPNCSEPTNEALLSQYYIAGRTCSGIVNPSTPPNFYTIGAYISGEQGNINSFEDYSNVAYSAYLTRGWAVYLIHAIDGDNGYSPTASSLLQATVNYFSTNQSTYWVQTFGNVVRYIQERNAVSLSETIYPDLTMVDQVTDNLDNSIYNYPVTFRRPLPPGWSSIVVLQNNQAVNAQVVMVDTNKYIMFDAVPNAGDVTIEQLFAPVLTNSVLSSSANITFRLNGQTGVSYIIKASSDLQNWSPVQTNRLVATSTNFTFAVSNKLQFYRAQCVP
jgi:peptidoglycan/xylan/chitin deacetylase (PgdA/CDA1 family)